MLQSQESTRQFAFTCARGLAAWLGFVLFQQAYELVCALASMAEIEGVAAFVSELRVMLWTSLVLAVIAVLLWRRADRFSTLIVDGIRPGDPTTRLPWEQPVVYALGLWLVLASLPGLGFLLARLVEWHDVSRVLSMNPGGFFDGYDDLRLMVTASVRALAGLLVLINARRIADWSSGADAPRPAPPPDDTPA